MTLKAYPIQSIGQGFLTIMPRPDTQQNPAAVFAAIAALGTTHLVSLLEASEAKELGLSEESNWCSEHNMIFMHQPIKDFTLPVDVTAFLASMASVHALARQGANVVIHCRAGIGRSGMAASALLMFEGMTASEAIAMVSESRARAIPDTEEQRLFIHSLEERITFTRP